MYQRRRTVFGFNGSGEGSAIYKSNDSGETWNQLNLSLTSLAGGSNGALWDSAGVPTAIGVSYSGFNGLDQVCARWQAEIRCNRLIRLF